MKLWKYIKDAMMKNPSQTVCEEDAAMRYDELVVFSELFAKEIGDEKCCAIICGSEMAASMALLACFAAEVTAVPLSVRYGELHCDKILDAICPTAIITDMDGKLQVTKLHYGAYSEPKVHPALIMCTSGTTGAPKGAMLSEDNILANVRDIAEYFKIDRSDAILITRPLYHCAVLTGEFLTALVKGTKIRFYSDAFNPALVLNLVRTHSVSVFCGTPTLLGIMARFKRSIHEDSLRHIAISGECLGKEAAQQVMAAFPKAKIYHVYGLTEACPRVSYLPPEYFRDYGDCVGVPLRSVELRILRADGSLAKTNEIGVLWVKGDNVMIGYYNDMPKTAEVLKNRWLCTGDLALINEKGLLKIKGRNDDLIIKAGMNIYPGEVENVLHSDCRVKDVLVYGFCDGNAGAQIGMKIVGDFHSESEVRQLCTKYLPSYQIPWKIEIVESLPKNGSGKLVRGKRHV